MPKQVLSSCADKLASNRYPVLEREMDPPTYERITTEGQAKGQCQLVKQLRVPLFHGERVTPAVDISKGRVGQRFIKERCNAFATSLITSGYAR